VVQILKGIHERGVVHCVTLSFLWKSVLMSIWTTGMVKTRRMLLLFVHTARLYAFFINSGFCSFQEYKLRGVLAKQNTPKSEEKKRQ